MPSCISGLLNKNEKFIKIFWFKDPDTQNDLLVIELHTQLNQNYNELKIKIKKEKKTLQNKLKKNFNKKKCFIIKLFYLLMFLDINLKCL